MTSRIDEEPERYRIAAAVRHLCHQFQDAAAIKVTLVVETIPTFRTRDAAISSSIELEASRHLAESMFPDDLTLRSVLRKLRPVQDDPRSGQ